MAKFWCSKIRATFAVIFLGSLPILYMCVHLVSGASNIISFETLLEGSVIQQLSNGTSNTTVSRDLLVPSQDASQEAAAPTETQGSRTNDSSVRFLIPTNGSLKKEGALLTTTSTDKSKVAAATTPPPVPKVIIPSTKAPSLPPSPAQPLHPFEGTSPLTLVLLLSYQRTGSSFIGNLFHYSRNPHVFYIYEPLDPVYTAMYSTDMGWNVPTDMRTFSNGEVREFPVEELDAMEMMLESVYTCSMSELPPAMLLHRFWSQFKSQMNSTPYISCLSKKSIRPDTVLNTCRSHIRTTCAGRFDGKFPRLKLCRDILYNNGKWTSSREELATKVSSRDIDNFMNYFSCLNKYREAAKACAVEHFDRPCQSKSIRAVKTVRAGMQTAERLLEKRENFKVVHSFRDPRGASRSRSLASWSQGRYEGPVLKKIAHCYCRSVLQDHRLFRKLKERHPERITNMIFDDYVLRPVEVSKELLDFCDIPLSSGLQEWLSKATSSPQGRTRDNSQARNEKWKDTFKPQQISDINSECHDFFTEIPFNWPSTSS